MRSFRTKILSFIVCVTLVFTGAMFVCGGADDGAPYPNGLTVVPEAVRLAAELTLRVIKPVLRLKLDALPLAATEEPPREQEHEQGKEPQGPVISKRAAWSGSFSSGTLFIGDSLTYGFVKLYLIPNGYIGDASYMAVGSTGASQYFSDDWLLDSASSYGCIRSPEYQGKPFYKAVEAGAGRFDAVYLLLGSNYSRSTTESAYELMIDHIARQNPEAEIFIQTVPDCETGRIDSERINSVILSVLENYSKNGRANVTLLNTNSVWTGSCIGSDGVHLTALGYAKWFECIVTNTFIT